MSKKVKGSKIEEAIKQLEKTYGENVILKLDNKPLSVPTLSTGILSLNNITGVGGYPMGRIIEIFGMESAGKTTLALYAVKEAQRKGLKVAYVDVENSLDINYARTIGINIMDLLISQPNSAEEALNIVETLVKTEEVGLIILDSVAALVPMSEEEGEMGDTKIGLQARLMSQAMRKLKSIVNKSNSIVIFINQMRDKIGGYGGKTTSGGYALKFYASLRCDISKTGVKITSSDKIIGEIIRVKIVKNKLAPPFTSTEIELVYGKGFDPIRNLITFAEEKKVIKKAGSWYSYGDTSLGQGKDKVVALLEDNKELAIEIFNKCNK